MFQAPYTRAFAGMRLEISRIAPLDAIELRTAASRHINAHPRPTSPVGQPPSRNILSKPKTPPHRLFHSQVVSDGNIMLTDEEVDKLEVLCISRGYVKFGRKFYSHRLNEPFGKFGTVRTVKSNVELDAVNTESDIDSC